MVTAELLYLAGVRAFTGPSGAAVTNWRAGLASTDAADLGLRSTPADLAEIAGDGYARLDLADWEIEESGDGAFATAEALDENAWENTGEEAWPETRTIFVTADVHYDGEEAATERLMWFREIDEPLALPAGDRFLLGDERVRIELAGSDDG